MLGSLLGSVVLSVDVLAFNILHLSKNSWLATISQLILGHPMRGLAEVFVGVIAKLVFSGILGGVYARYVVPQPGVGHYPMRGVGFAAVIWFATFSLGTVFRIPRMTSVAWQTAIVQLATVSLWGFLLGWSFARLEERFGASSPKQSNREASGGRSASKKDGAQTTTASGASDQGQSPSATAQAQPPSMDALLMGVQAHLAESSEVLKDLREALLRLSETMEEPTGAAPDDEQESWAANLRHPVNLEDWHPGSGDEDHREERWPDRH